VGRAFTKFIGETSTRDSDSDDLLLRLFVNGGNNGFEPICVIDRTAGNAKN
jgi:hypothetical protein